MRLEKSVVAPEDDSNILMVEVSGVSGTETMRAPVAMAIVIDTSGSMRAQKIADARAAAHALVNRLSEGDTVTIITYASSATVILGNHTITSNRQQAHNAIEQITATGSTCMSCGLELAYGILSDAAEGFTPRVVMLSDGNANHGVSDEHGLRAMASLALEAHNVPTSTIGLGADYNEDLMTALADGGAGAYYFLPNSDAIVEVLDREFSQLEAVVASNVIIRLVPSPGTSFGAVTNSAITIEADQILINIGQISAGMQRQVVVPLVLSEGSTGDVVLAQISYEDASGEARQRDTNAAVARSANPEEVAASRDLEVAVQYERLTTAQLVETALVDYQAGEREQAQAQLQQNATRLRQQAVALDAPSLAEQAEQIENLCNYLATEGEADGDGVDRVRRHNRARSREVQRGEAEEAQFAPAIY